MNYRDKMISAMLKNALRTPQQSLCVIQDTPEEPKKKMDKETGKIADLLMSAVNKVEVSKKEFNFYLQGDLCQMGLQKSFLLEHDFIVEQSDVYPVLNEADVPKALTLLFENKIEGWWHYKKELSELGITSEEPSNPNVSVKTQAAMFKHQYNTEEVKKEKVVLNKKKAATSFNRRVKW